MHWHGEGEGIPSLSVLHIAVQRGNAVSVLGSVGAYQDWTCYVCNCVCACCY